MGAIQIVASSGGAGPSTSLPAVGTFRIEDVPGMPAGNRRRIVFQPELPNDPGDSASGAGLLGGREHTIVLPDSGSTLRFGGRRLAEPVLSCFRTCDPSGATLSSAFFTDLIAGPPAIVRTSPATAASVGAGSPIDPTTLPDGRLSIFFSEPIVPAAVSTDSVRILDVASGVQVPGSISFYQAGSPEAGPTGARIDYVLSSVLPADKHHRLEISGQVRDFGDNPVRNSAQTDPPASDPASPRRLLFTQPLAFCRAPTVFGGDFPQDDPSNSSNRNLASLGGAFRTQSPASDPNNKVTSVFPFDLVGDGAAGALNFSGLQTIDSAAAPSPGISNGTINAISVTVSAGSRIRVTGEDYPVHIRSLGPVAIDGRPNASGGDDPSNRLAGVAYPDPDATGQDGQGNSDGGASTVLLGGAPGAGGGRGGHASTSVSNARGDRSTGLAQSGWGPARNGVRGDPDALGSDADLAAAFGGGQGGESGHGQLSIPRDLGGFGGAGGSNYRAGGNGGPYENTAMTATCPTSAPLPAVLPRTRAVAAPLPATATLPPTVFTGGSGGGAGGDAWNFMGAGGGARGDTSFCSVNSGGNGGGGLVMLEDRDGSISTNFLPLATSSGRISPELRETAAFRLSSNLSGTATSICFDTGYGDPNYPAPPTERFNLGDAPGATVTIEYQGAFEAVAGGTPDLGNLSPWVAASSFTAARTDPIDGYRFIRYRIVASFDPPMVGGGGTNPGSLLPSIQEVSIPYETPIACTTLN